MAYTRLAASKEAVSSMVRISPFSSWVRGASITPNGAKEQECSCSTFFRPKFWKRNRIFYCFSIACDEKRKSVLSTSLPQGTLRILRRLYLICAIVA